MAPFKFVMPQKLDDLIHPQEDTNVFYVNDELTSLEIAQKIPSTENELNQDPLAIADQFSVFYSVLKNSSDLDHRVIDRAWTVLYKATNSLKEQLREIFVTDEAQSQQHSQVVSHFETVQERINHSNALKMLVYLSCSFIQHYEDALASQTHRQNFGDKNDGKRKKAQRDTSFYEYDKLLVRMMKDLLHLISIPLSKITDSPTEARDIPGQVLKVCYKMIENSAINNLSKNSDLLATCFSILGCGIEKYDQSLSFCLKFIQLLQHREQLAPLLADLVEFIVTKHDQRLLIGEILREIDRIDIKDLSRDSSCPRAVSTFLISLSEKCPKEFIQSLNHMFGYLEQDSYIMRNASLSIMTNLIIEVLHKEGEDKSLRDEVLDALLAHICDIVGYTRSKALSLWCSLCEHGFIPLTYLEPVTRAAVGRLQDKSCLVRKNAVRFIISVLNRNPYAERLPIKAFIEQYELEKAVLSKLVNEEKKKLEKEEELLETLSQDSMASINSDTDPNSVHPNIKMKNLALTEESAVVTQERKVIYLQETIGFTRQILKAIPLTVELLSSKSITDIQEAIDFFVHCHEKGIDEALVGFKRMILLMNVQEKSVKDAVFAAYRKIFFESSRYEGKSKRDSLVVGNLISFVEMATVGECISFEILMGQFKQNKDITAEMERELWATFTMAKANTTIEEAIAAIQLIGMIAPTEPEIINHNLQICLQYGLATSACGEQESRLVRETCIAIRKSLPRKVDLRPMRLARTDEIFVRLQDILVDSFSCNASLHWFSMCDEATRIIFDMAENPDKICESIFERMVDKLLKNAVPCNSISTQDTNRNDSPDLVFQPSATHMTASQNLTTELVHPVILSRFLHFLGDVALDLTVFLEMNVLVELKRRNNPNNTIVAHNVSISSRRRSRRYNKSMDEQQLEEEIGLGGAEAEDADAEFIESICDEEIVCGKNLLAKLSRVVLEVAKDPIRYHQTELKQSSSLALAKCMMVSYKFCQDHLRLLFTILEKTKDSSIKINLLIAISDLCVRFPNLLDGWNGKIFDCLQSEDVAVRRAALKILSRLVLCDILKAKDHTSTMANLIVDEDEQIAAFSKHFFLELSKKLNAIYNVLPDIISRLSDSKTGISEENFRIVMKFLFDLIDKSQHIDRLVDKLCGRFMDTDDERHWSDLAYCISLLKHSDKSMMKLYDKFDCYKDKLCIDSVRESLSSTIANYKKTPSLKNEMKQILDEFELKIAKCLGEVNNDEDNEGEPKKVEGDTELDNSEETDVETDCENDKTDME